MNTDDEDRLLDEIFSDENVARARAGAMERGIAQIRRRRRARTVTHGVGLAIVAFALVFWARSTKRPDPAPIAATPAAARPVPFINDEQLFALLGTRAVALVGPAGHQTLVTLPERSSTGRDPRAADVTD